MGHYDIESHVKSDMNDKKRKYDEKKKRLTALQSSRFENRKSGKQLIGMIALIASCGVCAFLAANGISIPAIFPIVNVVVAQFIGDVVESIIFKKDYKEDYNLLPESENQKEQQEFYLSEKLEDYYVQELIAENKFEYTESEDFKKRRIKKDSNKYSQFSKEDLLNKLKNTNTQITLSKKLKDYNEPTKAYVKESLKAIFDSLPLLLASLLSQLSCGMNISLLTSLVPFGFGLLGYGNYHIGLANTRRKIYDRSLKKFPSLEIESLEELESEQKLLVNNIVNKSIKEEYEREIDSFKKLDTSKFVKKQIFNEDERYYHQIANNIFDNNPNLEVSIGENSKAKILRKKPIQDSK